MTDPTERTRVKRVPKRGHYDKGTIYGIIDEAIICHVGFVVEGQPYVIPTSIARDGDDVIIHGSSASRMLRTMRGAVDVCVTVTHADGIVVARSAFHCSMNYRSAVLLGRATIIEGDDAKRAASRVLVEHLIPGRWNDCRQPNDVELKATTFLRLPIDEASAKIRTGGPVEEEEDYALPHWAGVIPIPVTPSAPVPDERLDDGISTPDYISKYSRRQD